MESRSRVFNGKGFGKWRLSELLCSSLECSQSPGNGIAYNGRAVRARSAIWSMKQQRFGKGRVEVKTIWIEPYICRGAGLVREEMLA